MNINLKINEITDLNITVTGREAIKIIIEVDENDTTNMEMLGAFDYEIDKEEGDNENLYDLALQSEDISSNASFRINDFPFE